MAPRSGSNVARRLGLVGESGCGKSMTLRAVLGLLPRPAVISGGQVLFEGEDLGSRPTVAAARAPRQGHRHDLPGADDGPEPGDAGGGADRGGAPGPPRLQPPALPRAGARADAAGRHPRPPAPRERLPPRAVGGYAAARDDRHRALLRAASDPLRRAHHCARRDHPGSDPEAAAEAARGARHERGVRHPRPRGGRPDLSVAGGDVRRPGGRKRHRARRLPSAPAPLHAGAVTLRARRRRRARVARLDSRQPARPGVAAARLPLRSALRALPRATASSETSRCSRSATGRVSACIHPDKCAAAVREQPVVTGV